MKLKTKTSRNLFTYLNCYFFFAVIFLFNMIFILQGLDVTDFGKTLVYQSFSFTRFPNVELIQPLTFLSDFFGGFWLKAFGEPNVLWARVGGVLLISASASLVYSILSSYFSLERVFYVVLISTIFLTTQYQTYINHYSFPAFLIVFELWLLNKVILISNQSRILYSFLLGVVIVPIILSRVTLILILLIPLSFIVYYLITRRDFNGFKAVLSYCLFGMLISSIIFGLLYWYLGILNYFFSYSFSLLFQSIQGTLSTSGINPSHNLELLLNKYLSDFIIIVSGTIVLLIGLFIISKLKQKFGEYFTNALLLGFTCFCIIFFIIFNSKIIPYGALLLKITIGMILVLSIYSILYYQKENNNLSLLLIAGVVIMIISPIGSDNGLLFSFYGMWIILPLSILSGSQIQSHGVDFNIGRMLSLLNIILVVMLILALFFHISTIYRDNQNRLNLNTMFSHPSLWGIYSTSDRVEVVDDLLMHINENTEPGDEVLMVDSIPLFYYLTATRPALGHPWIKYDQSIETIKAAQENLKRKGNYPKLFIISDVYTENSEWPDTNTIIADKSNEKTEYLKDEYLNRLNYSLLWKNRAFSMYIRTNKGLY